MTLIYSALAAIAYIVVGCAVLSAADDDEGRLLEWAQRTPYIGLGGFVSLWPASAALVMFLRWRQKRHVPNS